MEPGIRDKKDVNLDKSIKNLVKTLDNYVEENKKNKDTEIVYTAHTYLQWLKTKTEIVQQEKEFVNQKPWEIKRGKVVWIEFGFNIGQEFGGKHPAIIYRQSGQQVFVFPLTTQKPKEAKPQYVKIPFIYDFPPMTRWVNVLNIKSVSINRIDFTSPIGRVKGEFLDKISNTWNKVGIK